MEGRVPRVALLRLTPSSLGGGFGLLRMALLVFGSLTSTTHPQTLHFRRRYTPLYIL
jgi:hypothetical protein